MGIEVQSVYKSYTLNNEKMNILKDINFRVRTSEVVAILGTSGSGKSTLLSLLGGLDSVDQGRIKINGEEITAFSESQLTKYRGEQLSIIFQNFYLISHLTAVQNISLPLEISGKKFTEEEVLQRLADVGLSHRATHTPKQLSGGECQRLALARALIVQPSLLLADEPSGSLDAATGEKMMDLFFTQVRKQKTTTVLVTHDVSLSKKCDRVFKIEQGQLWEV